MTNTGEMLALLARFDTDLEAPVLERLRQLVGDLERSLSKDHASERIESESAQKARVTRRAELIQEIFQALVDNGVDDPTLALFLSVFRNDADGVKLALAAGASTTLTDSEVLSQYRAMIASVAPDLYARYWMGNES